MNPHSHDYRDTVRAGEKTGSAYQAFRTRRENVSPWFVVSVVLLVIIFLILVALLPESPPW